MKTKSNITELKPPAMLIPSKDRFDIFLAGSIENGKAEQWQSAFRDALKKMKPKLEVGLFNPRRDNWDASWTNTPNNFKNKRLKEHNPQLIEQIEWELEHLEKAQLIVMYLQPGTISPISLLELGLFAKEVYRSEKQMIVLCPDGFHRQANVDVVCQYYDISIAKNMEELIKKTKIRIKDHFAPKSKKLKFYK